MHKGRGDLQFFSFHLFSCEKEITPEPFLNPALFDSVQGSSNMVCLLEHSKEFRYILLCICRKQ